MWWIVLSAPITAEKSTTCLGASRGRRGGKEEGREAARGESDDENARGGAVERKEEEEEDHLEVTYTVRDARSCTYEPGSFHLVVEKVTLDAMLPNKTWGTRDFIKIVSNMGRICKVDG